MPSSPGASQRVNSSQDVPMTDQTDDDPYEVCTFTVTFRLRLTIIELPEYISYILNIFPCRMMKTMKGSLRCTGFREHLGNG